MWTVGMVADVSKAAGIRPSVLIGNLLRALEDNVRGDSERGA